MICDNLNIFNCVKIHRNKTPWKNKMLTNSEIAKQTAVKPISQIANQMQIEEQFLMPEGKERKKVHRDA